MQGIFESADKFIQEMKDRGIQYAKNTTGRSVFRLNGIKHLFQIHKNPDSLVLFSEVTGLKHIIFEATDSYKISAACAELKEMAVLVHDFLPQAETSVAFQKAISAVNASTSYVNYSDGIKLSNGVFLKFVCKFNADITFDGLDPKETSFINAELNRLKAQYSGDKL